jgi:ATP phosphoribosyltransferase
MIRLGLPKGRMASDSDKFCEALGVTTRSGVLSYQAVAEGLELSVFLLKAPDVAWMLRRNMLDLGLTGDEWLMETGADLDCRCFEVRSYKASVCLLMAEGDPRAPRYIRSVATPYPNLAQRLLSGIAPEAEIIPVRGSTEALVPGVADACIDLVETGMSAAVNSLMIRECFDQVTTHLVRSEASDPRTVRPIVERLADTLGLVR